jgi:thioredoxin-like negative regulator of GroEL
MRPATFGANVRPRAGADRAVLLFFSSKRSGPSRRMASLVAWVQVNEKRRLSVLEVDTDEHRQLADELEVSEVPTLVLVRGATVLGRLDGRATGHAISRLIDAHLR